MINDESSWIFFIRYPLFFLSILFQSCQSGPGNTPPNIILILADDMGYSDIGFFGSEIPTPNIDFLAENGLVITQFYNASRCCPTRASLLTGLYPHQAGMGDMVEGRLLRDSTFLPAYQGWLNKNTPTIAEELKKAGYQTFISGKWHVGDAPEHWPDQRGFDRSFSLINGASNYFNLSPWINEQQDIILTLDGKRTGTDDDFYMTTAITGHALDFIRHRDKDRPFFLYLSFTAPHWPLHALPEDVKRFEGKYLEGWERIRSKRFARQIEDKLFQENTLLSHPFYSNPLLTPSWDSLPELDQKIWDKRMAVYAAQVYRMDREIGRIIKNLTEIGILKNTLVIFLSDNGATQAAIYLAKNWVASRSGEIGSAESFDAYGASWANASNTPFRLFKHWTTEGGIATPFIAFWPARIKAGLEREQYGHVMDLLPTCMEAAGITAARNEKGKIPLAGKSLFPLFSGKTLPGERTIFWEHQGNWAVRRGDWKLVFTREVNRKMINDLNLYNIRSDRSEANDLSNLYPEIVYELDSLYQIWADQTGVEPWDSLILARNL